MTHIECLERDIAALDAQSFVILRDWMMTKHVGINKLRLTQITANSTFSSMPHLPSIKQDNRNLYDSSRLISFLGVLCATADRNTTFGRQELFAT